MTSNYDCLAAKIVTTLRAFTVPGRHLLKDFYLISNVNKVYLPHHSPYEKIPRLEYEVVVAPSHT